MGDRVIDVDKIPDIMFTDAVQKYEISLVEILSNKERKYGEPDVIVHQLDGSEIRITRSELVSNYRYLNNQRIRLCRWRNRHKVALFKTVDKPVAVLYIRNNIDIDYGDKTKSKIPDNGEYYIVCELIDGSLDREHYSLVERELFSKAYVISTTLDTDIVRSELGIGEYRNTDDMEDAKINEEYEDGADDGDGYVGYDFDDEDDNYEDGGTDALDDILNSFDDMSESDRLEDEGELEDELENEDRLEDEDKHCGQGNYTNELDNRVQSTDSRQSSRLGAGSRTRYSIDKAKYISDIASESERMVRKDISNASKDNTAITYTALGRLITGGKVIGFKVTDGKRVLVMSNKDVMILAQRNGIDNIGVKVVDGKTVLYGIGGKISDLEGIKLGD